MKLKREALIQALDELIEEANTTAGMIGGEGPMRTPFAFAPKGKASKSLKILRKYLTDVPKTRKHSIDL